ncbi:MAG: metallophosphoesterase [Desulfobacterales bacterium]|jgi:predicted MPP superfamily phosphohydrolase|nr:metallophosphoesterase [Desulfobacterales bacterium]
MLIGSPFFSFRITILMLAALAQVYIFIRARRAIDSSAKPAHFKQRAAFAVGTAMALLFAANAVIMFRPIPWVDPPPAAQIGLFYPPAVWSLGAIFCAILLLITRLAGALARAVLRVRRALSPPQAPAPVDPGRRRFLRAGAAGLATAPFLLCGYGAAHAGREVDIEEIRLPFGRPLRVVQLTDIHAGIFMTRTDMRRYVDTVIRLQPDLFVLTGDYVSNSIAFLPGCLEEMARVRARWGTFATLGNHEHWVAGVGELRDLFERHRIPLLQNEHRVVATGRGSFAVAGIDDLRSGRPDLGAALSGLDPSTPTILLSHRPEIFPRAAAAGVEITLAGHYHGGQVKLTLPGRDLSLAHLRTPYPEGLFRLGPAHLYVSRGIGTTFTPVRLNAPPEVTLLELS